VRLGVIESFNKYKYIYIYIKYTIKIKNDWRCSCFSSDALHCQLSEETMARCVLLEKRWLSFGDVFFFPAIFLDFPFMM
jgi:hypothetical protein